MGGCGSSRDVEKVSEQLVMGVGKGGLMSGESSPKA